MLWDKIKTDTSYPPLALKVLFFYCLLSEMLHDLCFYQGRWKLGFSLFFLTCTSVTQVAKVSILDKLAPNITLQAQIDERRCICIKQHGSDRGEYKPVCGQCRDPCALRFIPRNSVEYLQKLTLGDNAISEVIIEGFASLRLVDVYDWFQVLTVLVSGFNFLYRTRTRLWASMPSSKIYFPNNYYYYISSEI